MKCETFREFIRSVLRQALRWGIAPADRVPFDASEGKVRGWGYACTDDGTFTVFAVGDPERCDPEQAALALKCELQAMKRRAGRGLPLATPLVEKETQP